jgi:hypothetical protein
VRCVAFIARHEWGRPIDRARDILQGVGEILRDPLINRVKSRRRKPGLEYRRHNAAQFAIIYVCVSPSALFPRGMISIRAIRHASERNVFWGVKEPPAEPYCVRRVA